MWVCIVTCVPQSTDLAVEGVRWQRLSSIPIRPERGLRFHLSATPVMSAT